MKKVIARSTKTNEELPYFTTQENPQDWVNNAISTNLWGLPERIVDDVEGNYDLADVIEHIDLVVTESVPAVLDEQGNVVTEEVPAVIKKQVKLKAEYTIEIVDISQEHALKECIANRKAEYPTMEEFLNAYFDGGESAVQALQAQRLAIKAKYPKP